MIFKFDYKKDRIIGLDILRSLAILLVLYGHGYVFIKSHLDVALYRIPALVDGVTLFFVLSGFLIGGILLKVMENSNFSFKDVFNFWVRRWFRTLPNYFFVLSALVIYQIWRVGDLNGFDYRYFFFLQNFNSAHPAFFSEAWSLAVEEWFYLTLPIFTFISFKLFRRKKMAFLITAFLFLIIPFALRLYKFQHLGLIQDVDLNYKRVMLLRLDSLIYGILGAYVYFHHRDFFVKDKFKMLLLGISLIIFSKISFPSPKEDNIYNAVFRFNVESVAVLFSLPYFSQLKTISINWLSKIFTFISIISYSIYLLNLSFVSDLLLPKLFRVTGLDGLSGILSVDLLKYAIYLIVTITLSYILYSIVEKPMMDLREKISK